MTAMNYAVTVTSVPFVGFLSFCRDLPEVQAFASDAPQALRLAADQIARVLHEHRHQGRALPRPSPLQPGECWLAPSPD